MPNNQGLTTILDEKMLAGAGWIWLEPDVCRNNAHVLFRKRFVLTGRVLKAVCHITANTSFELFVNGQWIGRGPARSWPEWQYVESYNLTDCLAAGENIIAVHAYHHGEDHVGVLTSCAGPGGLIARIIADGENGARLDVVTDESWRMLCAPQYAVNTGFLTWHREDYKEQVDMRLEPAGWTSVGHDDAAWRTPRLYGVIPCPPWTRLIPNPLPPMSRETFCPVNVFTHHSGSAYGFCKLDVVNPEAMLTDDGQVAVIDPVERDFDVQLLFDFGKPAVGRFHIDIADATAGEICVSYGDSLNLTRIDKLELRAGAQHYAAYERRFGRYAMLTLRRLAGPVSIRRVWCELVTYPVQLRGAFECSDAILNRIWETGRWTVRMNMHDHFEDCPFREQLLYCGDIGVSNLLAYYAFGDYALARESILKLARLQYDDGRIPNGGHVPKKSSKSIPEYPAIWLIALYNYWMHSGDAELVKTLWPSVVKLLDWYAGWHDDNGMMRQLPTDQRSDFVDNLAGIPMDGQVLAVQCFYLHALRAAERMASESGDAATAKICAARRQCLRDALNRHFWDKDLRGYRSCLAGSGAGKSRLTPDIDPDPRWTLSRISNGMALYAGVPPPARIDDTIGALVDPARASPARSGYMNHYIVESLFHAGRANEAIRLVREYWGGMLERGATAFWECFDPDMPSGREPDRMWSLCHAFCAGPVYSLPAHILGVSPLAPGFAQTKLAPVCADLQWARGQAPTPLGSVDVDWKITDDGRTFRMNFSRPARMEIQLFLPSLPGGWRQDGACLDGQACEKFPIVLPARDARTSHLASIKLATGSPSNET